MSKGLKALEVIKNAPTVYVGLASDIYTRHSFECKAIEKELKALEIIKNNKVDVNMIVNSDTYIDYIQLFTREENFNKIMILEEEFYLLKEVLL